MGRETGGDGRYGRRVVEGGGRAVEEPISFLDFFFSRLSAVRDDWIPATWGNGGVQGCAVYPSIPFCLSFYLFYLFYPLFRLSSLPGMRCEQPPSRSVRAGSRDAGFGVCVGDGHDSWDRRGMGMCMGIGDGAWGMEDIWITGVFLRKSISRCQSIDRKMRLRIHPGFCSCSYLLLSTHLYLFFYLSTPLFRLSSFQAIRCEQAPLVA